MTVEKGVAWGAAGPPPEGMVVVRSDAEARAALESARRDRMPFPPLGLLGGDLARTLGAPRSAARLADGPVTVCTVDVGEVLLDGRVRYFVAHCIVRRSWWRGAVVAAMNAQYVGDWDVAPRAHPGDGVLEVVEVDAAMRAGERWKARRRLPTGTHVPHPAIKVKRLSAVQLDVDGLGVWLDGEKQPPASALSIRLQPDALTVCV